MAGLLPNLKKRPLDFTQREDRVDRIAADMMKRDNPLMAKARASGMQVANRRGLLNSSLAAATAESAALDQVVPMAGQTAGQEFQKNRAGQDYGISRGLAAQASDLRREEMKDAYGYDNALLREGAQQDRKGIWTSSRADRASTKAEYGLRSDLSAQEAEQQRRGIRTDYRERGRLSEQEAEQAVEAMRREYGMREGFARTQGRIDRRAQSQDEGFRARQAEFQREAEEKLARLNLSGDSKRLAQTALDASFSNYEDNVRSILSNPDIPASERTRMIDASKQMLRRRTDLTAKLYKNDMEWPGGVGFR